MNENVTRIYFSVFKVIIFEIGLATATTLPFWADFSHAHSWDIVFSSSPGSWILIASCGILGIFFLVYLVVLFRAIRCWPALEISGEKLRLFKAFGGKDKAWEFSSDQISDMISFGRLGLALKIRNSGYMFLPVQLFTDVKTSAAQIRMFVGPSLS